MHISKTELLDLKRALIELHSRTIQKYDPYVHKAQIPPSEQPYIFFKNEEKNASVERVISNLETALEKIVPHSTYRNQVFNRIQKTRQLAEKKMQSCDSFFFFIEFNGGAIDDQPQKNKIYEHYHPPRQQGKDYLNTLTYILPLYEVTQNPPHFKWIDLNKHQLHGHDYTYFKDKDPAAIITDYNRLSTATKNLEWSQNDFPSSGILELICDSFRYFHCVENITDDIYLIMTFNEVIFKNDFTWSNDRQHLECHYYNE